MDEPSVRRERVAHTLAVELTRRCLNCHRIEGIGVTIVERAVSVWITDTEVRWRVGPDLQRWERHSHVDLSLNAERIVAYVCGTGAVR